MGNAEMPAELILNRPTSVSRGRWLDVLMSACTTKQIEGLIAFSIDTDQVRLHLALQDPGGRPADNGATSLGPGITSVLSQLHTTPGDGLPCPAPDDDGPCQLEMLE